MKARKITLIVVFAVLSCFGFFSILNAADQFGKPDRPVRLIFIHHSTGEAWLSDDHGELGISLRNNNYFVSDTNYGWGPVSLLGGPIGDYTDIGHWWSWFRSSESGSLLQALYQASAQNCGYSRMENEPAGPNQIIMFKSCFPNSALQGQPDDPVPAIESNPLVGDSSGSASHTVANAKGIYIDLLNYFQTRRDKLFIVVAAPPLSDATYSSNARAFNQWLVNTWLDGYPYKNVFVFDFYNVLTTNGGSPDVNDRNQESGNHHRWWNGAIQHKTNGDDDGNPNVLEYASGDDHPTGAGDLKATSEFQKLLNVAYNRWKPSLAQALDNNTLVWSTGGDVKWLGQTAVSQYLGDAAQSGDISNGQRSWLSTTVTGPGTLRFYWRVSSQQDSDFLRFRVNGSTKARISGSSGWRHRTCQLGAGTHQIQWDYIKDGNSSSGTDSGYLDRVQWTAAP
ncbi:MAG: hypothetical protein AB9866_11920 [Syntrophobacteraceae bacterium]